MCGNPTLFHREKSIEKILRNDKIIAKPTKTISRKDKYWQKLLKKYRKKINNDKVN